MQSGNYKSHNCPDVDTKYVDLVIRVSSYLPKACDKAQMNGLWKFIGALNLPRVHIMGMPNPCFYAKLDDKVAYA